MNIYLIVGLFLTFCGGIGGIMMFWGQQQSSADDKADLIENMTDQNLNLKHQLDDAKSQQIQLKQDLEERDKKVSEQNDTILKLNQDLVSLNNKLVEKSDYMSNYLTGANGYPSIIINIEKAPDRTQNDRVIFMLVNKGKWPLYDISSKIYNYSLIKKKYFKRLNDSKDYIKRSDFNLSYLDGFDTPQITPETSKVSGNSFDLSDILLLATTFCRSKVVYQKIVFELDENHFYYGSQILDSKGDILFESFAPDCPEKNKASIKRKFELIANRLLLNLVSG